MPSTSSNSFRVEVTLDEASLKRTNLRLKALGEKHAGLAMRRGFRKWTTLGKKTMASFAPYGRSRSVETVRGQPRPNPHIRNAVAAKVKGWRKGQVVWAAIGIREIPRSYATPHWYARWVEFGHAIKVRPSEGVMAMRRARGETRRSAIGASVQVGTVRGSFFMTRTLAAIAPKLVPLLEAEKLFGRP